MDEEIKIPQSASGNSLPEELAPKRHRLAFKMQLYNGFEAENNKRHKAI